MSSQNIRENVRKILEELPRHVQLVAAAKARTPEEICEAVAAGISIIGENYVQEAGDAFNVIGNKVKWHFIGHLQKNKVRKAVEIFDVIETVDSEELAAEIDKRSRALGKVMSVFIEVNSGREPQKAGILPEKTRGLVETISKFSNIRVMGIMTMGPFSGDPEDARPYFMETKRVFDDIKEADVPGVEMRYLSMGMTNSYRVAVEEGANIVRIGTRIFGER